MLTIANLIRELRQPGIVTMPVCMADDVARIVIQKADLIDYLQAIGTPEQPAPWCVVSRQGDVRNLDIQS